MECIDSTIKATTKADPIPLGPPASLNAFIGVSGDTWQLEREMRLASRDYHTHILSVFCVPVMAWQREIAEIAAMLVIPPLGVLVLVALAAWLLPRAARWVVEGFRESPAPAMSTETGAVPATNFDPGARTRRSVFKLPNLHIPLAIQWILGLLILAAGGGISHMLSQQTKGAIGQIQASQRDARYSDLEGQLRAQLPRSVGGNVMAVDARVDDRGLIWTYQRQGPGASSDVTYLDSVALNACKNAAVQDVVGHGFLVRYSLIDRTGTSLGRRVIAKCP